MKIRLTEDVPTVRVLHQVLFPADEWDETPSQGNLFWLAWNEAGLPVGFASARILTYEPTVMYLTRAGVLPIARGKGIQKKLIKARERYGSRYRDIDTFLTYTVLGNLPSANSLIACGYRLFDPEYAWAGRKEALYWQKGLL